jgi:hypothetical protein
MIALGLLFLRLLCDRFKPQQLASNSSFFN